MKALDIMLFRFDKEVIGQILSQQSRGNDFFNGNTFYRASNGFFLQSAVEPEISTFSTSQLWTRGTSSAHDNKCLYRKFTTAEQAINWCNALKVAVNEYNSLMTEPEIKEKSCSQSCERIL